MIKTIGKAIKVIAGGGGSSDDEEDEDGPSQEEIIQKYEDGEEVPDKVDEPEKDKLRQGSKRDRSGNDSPVPDVSEYHKNVIAPTRIDEEATKMTVGEHQTRTIFINQWPDRPNVGFLDDVFMNTDVINDVSIHLSPYRDDEAKDMLEKEFKGAQVAAEERSSSIINQKEKARDLKQTKQMLDLVESSNAKMFDVSVYITLRGEDETELELATDQIIKKLRTSPAFAKPEVLKRQQMEAFQSVSPIAEDKLNYSTEMLGGAIGVMYPFSSTSFIEKEGIDYGIHAGNNSPIIIDRFGKRETGYNQLTFGKIGSGKSFGTKLEIMRSYIARDDIKIVMLDPLGGFGNVNTALGGDKITVGGSLGINPLEIHETPEDEQDEDVDPYSMTKTKVMDFFDMYFRQRGKELGNIKGGRGTLERAIDIAYRQNEIYPDDFESHANEAPTVLDVRDILVEMQEDPDEFARADSSAQREHIEQAASEVSIAFEQFSEGGEYSNLAKESEIDLQGNDVHYIDLKQREGSGKTGLMMHLLLSEVYEAAKRHDGKTLFAIDEAHILLQDSKSLDFLELVVRHSRHCDLGINFITQTIEEFYDDPKAEKIAQMCSIKKFHRVETGLDQDIRDALGLKPLEEEYIRTAQAGGDDVDYSQALVGVGSEGYMPCLVVASDFEEGLITFDEDELENRDQLEENLQGGEGSASSIQ